VLIVDLSPLTQQGIEAYKAGNKEEAVRLLSDALREDRQNEMAWLYLGAALDDPVRKKQAFQKVLEINPDNEKAKNALARLAGGASGASRSSRPSGSSGASAAPKKKVSSGGSGGEGFAVPFNIEGAPERVTIPYAIENGKMRAQQGLEIYTTRDFEKIVTGAEGATLWDVVFIGGVGVVATGAAILIGGLIGWPLRGFSGGFGGLLWPFFYAITSMIGTAAGFAGAVYASHWYIKNEKIDVPLAQHGMYFALVALPVMLVSAALTLISNALGVLIVCLFPLFAIAGLALFIYGMYLIKGAFDRVYGTDNNRGLITTAIAAGGWFVGAILASVLTSIVSGIFATIFRFRFF
jgi:hypothetical protein